MKIGDLFLRVLADATGFEADLVKKTEPAGTVAGQSLAKSIGASLKDLGFKAVGLAATAAFAIATKGALELENATARYRAETGASADEAERAGKVINRIAGQERTSLETVTDVAIRVRKDIGAVGPEADALTQAFVRFARVTKQDAAGAVTDFDDILDAWGLTAKDATIIQDKLLVSNQKYGGSIVDNQKALATLAPTLQAANLTIDDGIGLLNLFSTAGVDSAVAVTGMQKALATVKSPAELQALIADIIATEDPFLRAQKAADLFGAKAGPKLANVLKPGIGAIKDFEIGTDEAAGATNRAADILDNTWSGRVQKGISEASAALREFGSSFGPALTGAAALGSLFTAIGGEKLVAALAKSLYAAGQAGGDALASGLQSVWSGAGGTVVGNNIASRIENILDPTKSTVIGNAYRRAADKAGTVYLQALFAGDAVRGAVGPAIDKVGTALGTRLGKALSVAFAAVAIVELVKTFQDITAAIAHQTADLATQTGTFIQQATLDALINARKGVAEQLAAMGNDPIAEALGLSAKKGVQDALAALDAAIAAQVAKAEHDARASAEGWGDATGLAFATGMLDARDDVKRAAQTGIGEPARQTFAQAVKDGVAAGGEVVVAFAQGILDAQSAVGNAFAALVNQEKTEMTKAQEEAYLVGVLTSKELARGLNDGRPGVRLAAEEVQRQALERLGVLVTSGQPLGKKAMDELRAGLASKNPAVRAAAQAIAATIDAGVKGGNPKGAGSSVGGSINSGLKDKTSTIGKTARQIGIEIVAQMYAGIAAGRGGGFGGSGGGYNPFQASGGPVIAGRTYVVNENTPHSEFFIPSVSGRISPTMPGLAPVEKAATGGDTNIITVALPVTARPDPFETAYALQRLSKMGLLTPGAEPGP